MASPLELVEPPTQTDREGERADETEIVMGAMIDNRYALEFEIGQGAMARVYRAYDANLHRRVALKVSRFDQSSLRNEGRALAAVQSRHVASVYAMVFRDELGFIAIEHIEGESLAATLKKLREEQLLLDPEDAVRIACELCTALTAVEAAGYVHRDVKPSNVLLERRTDRVVLVDFGIATRPGPVGETAGTPKYAPLEQLEGGPATTGFDVFAAAVIAFELLTGEVPFAGSTMVDAAIARLAPLRKLPSRLRRELGPFDRVFLRALSRDPAERPSSAAELAAELKHALADYAWQSRVRGTGAVRTTRVLVAVRDRETAALVQAALDLALPNQVLHVELAFDPRQARAIAAERPPHIAVLSFDLDGSSGADLFAQLRAAAPRVEGFVVDDPMAMRLGRFRFACNGVRGFAELPLSATSLGARFAAWLDENPDALPNEASTATHSGIASTAPSADEPVPRVG